MLPQPPEIRSRSTAALLGSHGSAALESTTLRCMYELRTEHDSSHLPQQIDIGSAPSLLAALI